MVSILVLFLKGCSLGCLLMWVRKLFSGLWLLNLVCKMVILWWMCVILCRFVVWMLWGFSVVVVWFCISVWY